MDNSKKLILDLCGGTGSWSDPYREAGYDVRVITLPDYDITKTQFQPFFMVFWGNNGPLSISYENVYGILAAPPCTQFSIARNDKTAKKPRDFRDGLKIVDACMRVIRECRLAGPAIKFWALENPRGYLRQFIGKPAMSFNPCDFGDSWTKNTDLWGWFNFPKNNKVEPSTRDAIKYTLKFDGIMPQIPTDYKRPDGIRPRTIRRSITPPGFAQAFYNSNK